MDAEEGSMKKRGKAEEAFGLQEVGLTLEMFSSGVEVWHEIR